MQVGKDARADKQSIYEVYPAISSRPNWDEYYRVILTETQ
jgi:hypothetical protein